MKHKRTVLSVEDKLKVCDMIRRKISKTDIMLKYDIGKPTVNDICKRKERLTSSRRNTYMYVKFYFAFEDRQHVCTSTCFALKDGCH